MTIPGFKAYPYKERLPPAMFILCFSAYDWYKSWPVAGPGSYVSTGALVLLFLCEPQGRLFDFFVGMGVGAILVDVFAHFNAKAGALHNALVMGIPLLVVGISALMFLRGRRPKATSANP